ncbi:MAG: hypothetical protein IT497_05075 [Ottowia sp.]|nr:hypothetical protein [Ottowia sp.]
MDSLSQIPHGMTKGHALHDHFKGEIPEATKMLDKYLEIAAMGFDPKKKSK